MNAFIPTMARIVHFYFFQFRLIYVYFNFDILSKLLSWKWRTKLSVPFSPLMQCLDTKLTIDSF